MVMIFTVSIGSHVNFRKLFCYCSTTRLSDIRNTEENNKSSTWYNMQFERTMTISYNNICIIATVNSVNALFDRCKRENCREVSIASKPSLNVSKTIFYDLVFLYSVVITMHTYVHSRKIWTLANASRHEPRITLWTCKYVGRVYTTITVAVL